jgi:hypothetical protein
VERHVVACDEVENDFVVVVIIRILQGKNGAMPENVKVTPTETKLSRQICV